MAMKIRIWQINPERGVKVMFVNLEDLARWHGQQAPDPTVYDMVYETEYNWDPAFDRSDNLERIYRDFNVHRPTDFTGHSLSVSDVIELVDDGGKSTFHFCNSFGFREIPFDVSAQKQWDRATF